MDSIETTDSAAIETMAIQIAHLRLQLAARDSEKRDELENMATSFRAVIAAKNKKIKDLEQEICRLKIQSLEDQVASMKANHLQPHHGGSVDLTDNGTSSGTIRAKFTKISELQSMNVPQGSIRVAGLDWGIQIRTNIEGSKKYLAVFLTIKTRPISQSWSATVFYSIKIINQESKNKSYIRADNESVYSSTYKSWGLGKFMLFEDLINPFNGYVKDDSILLEIDFTVYPMQ